MSNSVYKSPKGRNIVESMYRKVLSEYSLYNFDQLFIPTKAGQTHVLRFEKKIMMHS